MKSWLRLLLAAAALGLAVSLFIWRDLISLRPIRPPISAETRRYGEDLEPPTRAILSRRLPAGLVLTGPRRDALVDLSAASHIHIDVQWRLIEPANNMSGHWVSYSVGGMTLAEALDVVVSLREVDHARSPTGRKKAKSDGDQPGRKLIILNLRARGASGLASGPSNLSRWGPAARGLQQ